MIINKVKTVSASFRPFKPQRLTAGELLNELQLLLQHLLHLALRLLLLRQRQSHVFHYALLGLKLCGGEPDSRQSWTYSTQVFSTWQRMQLAHNANLRRPSGRAGPSLWTCCRPSVPAKEIKNVVNSRFSYGFRLVKGEGVTDGPELLDAPLPAGHFVLKLLLGFLGIRQLLPQYLLFLSHGGDLQGEIGRTKRYQELCK